MGHLSAAGSLGGQGAGGKFSSPVSQEWHPVMGEAFGGSVGIS